MAFIVDAASAIDALSLKGERARSLRLFFSSGVSISLVTVGEIYEVAFQSPNPEAHLIQLRSFLRSFRILGLNLSIAERFAEVRSYLRRRGELIPDFDILVAATALHYDLTVVTTDIAHFGRIPDLKVYRPI